MNFFKKWFRKQCQEAWNSPMEASYPDNRKNLTISGRDHPDPLGSTFNTTGTRFVIYKADGGYVIESSVYDPLKDRLTASLRICGAEEELGNAVSQILTYNALTR